MLGVLPEYRNPGIGRTLKLHQRDDALRARHRADRVDLRSAGIEERLLQHGTAGRDRAPLRGESVWHHHQPAARRTADRSLRTPNGGSTRRACEAILAGPRARAPQSGTRSTCPPISRDPPRRAAARPPDPAALTASSLIGAFERGLAVTGFERAGRGGHLSAGAMGMKDRTRYAAPDPHAAGAFLRNQLRPHLPNATSSWWKWQAEGVSGWGEVTAGENPFYNEEWTDSAWLILRDYVAPRVLGRELARRAQTSLRSPRTSAATRWRAAVWKPRSGIWRRAATACRCGKHIGGGARREIPCGVSIGIQDSVAQLLEKIETRAGRRLSAHQDEDQAGLGCGRGAAGARALSRHQADGRRQFRLHAGRRRPPEASSTNST